MVIDTIYAASMKLSMNDERLPVEVIAGYEQRGKTGDGSRISVAYNVMRMRKMYGRVHVKLRKGAELERLGREDTLTAVCLHLRSWGT